MNTRVLMFLFSTIGLQSLAVAAPLLPQRVQRPVAAPHRARIERNAVAGWITWRRALNVQHPIATHLRVRIVHHVFGLQVAMYDIRVVSGLNTSGNL